MCLAGNIVEYLDHDMQFYCLILLTKFHDQMTKITEMIYGLGLDPPHTSVTFNLLWVSTTSTATQGFKGSLKKTQYGTDVW